MGKKEIIKVCIGIRHDETELIMPIYKIKGKSPGPTLGLIAGLHGDSFEAPDALLNLYKTIEPNSLKGEIIIIPYANIPAYEAVNRVGWLDYKDLNRSFPGKNDGNVTERIADRIVKYVINNSDYVINFQSGGLPYKLHEYVGYLINKEDSQLEILNLAKVFGLPILYESLPFKNVLRYEAFKRNIPSLLIEIGGEGRYDEALFNKIENGINNVLIHLNMLEGTLSKLPYQYFITRDPYFGGFLHSSASGFLKSNFKAGDEIKKGDVLGEIYSVFGKCMSTIKSPIDGIVLMERTLSSIRVGDWTYCIAEIKDRI